MLVERERMKRLILFGETYWSSPMSDSKEGEDSKSSLIDSGRDSKLEAKLNASFVAADMIKETLPKTDKKD